MIDANPAFGSLKQHKKGSSFSFSQHPGALPKPMEESPVKSFRDPPSFYQSNLGNVHSPPDAKKSNSSSLFARIARQMF